MAHLFIDIAPLGIGSKFQRPTVFEEQTIEDNLMMALKNKRGSFAVLTYAFSTSDKDRVLELATDIGLEGELHRQAGELSHGQKQWLEIGMLLAQQPKLLLVDEPTEGIQPSVIKDIGRAIEYLRDTQGLAIILVEQYLEFCRQLASKVYIMKRGEMVHQGPASDLDKKNVRKYLSV